MTNKIRDIQTVLLAKQWNRKFGYTFANEDTLLFWKNDRGCHYRVTVTANVLIITKDGQEVDRLYIKNRRAGVTLTNEVHAILSGCFDDPLKNELEILEKKINALQGPPKDTLLSIQRKAIEYLQNGNRSQASRLKSEIETYMEARKQISNVYRNMTKDRWFRE